MMGQNMPMLPPMRSGCAVVAAASSVAVQRRLMNTLTPAPASLLVHSLRRRAEVFTDAANLASMLDCARIRYRSV